VAACRRIRTSLASLKTRTELIVPERFSYEAGSGRFVREPVRGGYGPCFEMPRCGFRGVLFTRPDTRSPLESD
jgi:hypothetical protein